MTESEVLHEALRIIAHAEFEANKNAKMMRDVPDLAERWKARAAQCHDIRNELLADIEIKVKRRPVDGGHSNDSWISANDRMPGDYTVVLATRQNEVFAAYWDGVEWTTPEGCRLIRGLPPTHWQPLPEPL